MRASRGTYRLGRFTLEPRRQLLDSGRPVALGGKALDILSTLAEANGDLVTKDELMTAVWPGIVVEENAIQVHISATRKALADEAERLATVRGKGYRLELTDRSAVAPDAAKQVPAPLRRWIVAIILGVAGLVGALATLGRATAPDVATLAILPFSEIGGNAHGLGPGLTGELTTVLANNPRLRVSGRASAMAMAGRNADPRAIGRALNVSYLLQGSVQTAAKQARIQARLLNARTGTALWSHSFDVPTADMLQVQRQIASAIEGQLRATLASAHPTEPRDLVVNGDAYAFYVQAKGLLHRRTPSDYYAAEALLRRALAIDPGFAPAWAQLAIARRQIGFRDGPVSRVQTEALNDARRALQLAPNLAESHAAWVFASDFATPDAIPHLRTAIRLQPRNPEAWLWLGNTTLNRHGRFAEALAAWRRAAALDPLWSPAVVNATDLAASMGRWAEAASYVARVRRSGADPVLEARAQGRILMQRGAFADAAKLAFATRARAPARQTEHMDWMLAGALFPLGYRSEAAHLWASAYPPLLEYAGPVDLPAELKKARADPRSFWLDSGQPPALLRIALHQGRCEDVAKLYRSAFAGPEAFWREANGGWSERIDLGTLLMMCLDRSGHPREAAGVRGFLQDAVDRTLQQDPAPTHALAKAAFFMAADGDIGRSLSLLSRAVNRGWAPQSPGDLADIAEEPALATLRGQPAFDAIRARIRAHIAAERAKLGPLPPI